jgi:Ca2+-transporting ATPase|tara:strand:- start:4111 stop:6741 length:2631 start_codon:yes stop_codon:yes gene_type:complete
MYNKKIEEILKELKIGKKGLTEKEAEARLKKYGYNEIKEEKKISPLKIFLKQFHNVLIYILIVAVIISIFLGKRDDAIVIGIIVIVNAITGFRTEYKAEKSIEALKKLASLKATVIRDGKEKEIDAKLLVPGDIIKLETGDKIPADSRLIEIVELQTQEAALTGESLPVKKELKVLKEKTPLADRVNMIYSGTIITRGKGKAIVTSTGMQSQIGKIAKMIEEAREEATPLQKKLTTLGRGLGAAILVIVLIVFISGMLKGEPFLEFFIFAVALAVAGIPEGLPIVVTIGLSRGVQRMVKRHALIRKLPSAESLGSTTVICTDKTGTLTKNEMTVKKIYTNGKIIDVSGSGYDKKGEFLIDNKKINTKELELLLKIGVLNNDASFDDKNVIGDPTEAALIVSGTKAGIDKNAIQKKYPRKDEIPFSSERKIMTTMHNIKGENVAYVKGAPEVVLSLCNSIYENSKIKKLSVSRKKEILEINSKFANNALRVLGFAYKTVLDKKRAEKNLTFVGLQGMIDPPREGAEEAIKKCNKAGIKVVVVTGDNEITAKAIAKEIGIEGKSMTGHDLERVKEKDLEKHVEEIAIYARVNPEHKIKIVNAFKKKGHIVAMTGDGVNDAPALKKADIGVSMGITGTDVAKEASDMILTDDNFASIVNAVEEGRDIYDNIKKFVEYLLSSNLGEILTIFIAIMIGLPLPLIAIMILWINLATDGLPALALSVDPSEPNIMERKPRNPKERIISNPIVVRMLIVGVTMMIGTLAVFKLYNPETNLIYAQTMAFSTLMMYQMFNVLNCRSEFTSLFKVGVFSNMKLWGAILLSIIMQIIVVQISFFNDKFHTIPLTLMDWFYVVLVSSTVLIIVEIYKFVISKTNPQLTS